MISRLKSWFNPQDQLPQQDQQPLPEAIPANSDNTWVYIWNTTPVNIGHVAMQVGGDEPKMTAEQEGEYLSIWPKNLPAMGPTTVFPLKARLATKLSDDMEAEGEHKQATLLNDLESTTSMHGISVSKKEVIPPDHTYQIPNLDTEKMKHMISETRSSVESGAQRYQLFPAINIFNFFSGIPAYLSYDPVDIQQHEKQMKNRKSSYSANNCVTLVGDLLNAGGMPIKQSRNPMGITPNSLSDQIEEIQAAKMSNSNRY